MMLFTACKLDTPTIAHLVLAVSNGSLLLVNGDEHNKLEWVPADKCTLGKFFLSAEQQVWWDKLSAAKAEEPAEPTILS